MVERMGVEEFGMGDLGVALCLVEHAPEKTKQKEMHKSGRPDSFFFAPTDGFQYQILQKIPAIICGKQTTPLLAELAAPAELPRINIGQISPGGCQMAECRLQGSADLTQEQL